MARLFQRLVALNFLIAWASLLSQAHALVGSRGLFPMRALVEHARAHGLPGLLSAPTIFLLYTNDLALTAVPIAGLLVAALVLLPTRLRRVSPRACLAVCTLLYLSCANVLGFFWFPPDELLLECGLAAALLSDERPAPAAHLFLRLILFKLYFESGMAKLLSPEHDWLSGVAMAHYYETAPLPDLIAYRLHFLSPLAHRLESWFALFVECALPFAVFLAHRPRLFAAALLTTFQLGILCTSTFGFFSWISIALHVCLLDDSDLEWLADRLHGRPGNSKKAIPEASALAPPATNETNKAAFPYSRADRATLVFTGLYAFFSLVEGFGINHFDWCRDIRGAYRALHLCSDYRMFDHVNVERVEAELETSDGHAWTPQHLRHKPGDPARAPDYAAPHLPRLDILLWFHGSNVSRGIPPFVTATLSRLCHDPEAIQGFFAEPLPAHPQSVRISYYRYRFIPPEERSGAGPYWKREPVSQTPPISCDDPSMLEAPSLEGSSDH